MHHFFDFSVYIYESVLKSLFSSICHSELACMVVSQFQNLYSILPFEIPIPQGQDEMTLSGLFRTDL